MRRQIFITLVLLGVVVLAALQLTGALTRSQEQGDVRNVRFSEFTPLSPPTTPNTASLQTSLDRVSHTALNGQWAAAAHEVNRLEDLWRTIRAHSTDSLQIEQAITQGIDDLHIHVLARNLPGVLEAAEKLTAYFGRLQP